VIGDATFATRRGRECGFAEVEQAMAFEATHGGMAILIP